MAKTTPHHPKTTGFTHPPWHRYLDTHKPHPAPAVPPICNRNDHSFIVQSSGVVLAPCLDLTPGRRCLCGAFVIINHCHETDDGDLILLANIDSSTAAKFAKNNPALRTW